MVLETIGQEVLDPEADGMRSQVPGLSLVPSLLGRMVLQEKHKSTVEEPGTMESCADSVLCGPVSSIGELVMVKPWWDV